MWAELQTPKTPKNKNTYYGTGVYRGVRKNMLYNVTDGSKSESEVRFSKFFHLEGLGLKNGSTKNQAGISDVGSLKKFSESNKWKSNKYTLK